MSIIDNIPHGDGGPSSAIWIGAVISFALASYGILSIAIHGETLRWCPTPWRKAIAVTILVSVVHIAFLAGAAASIPAAMDESPRDR